MPLKYFFKKIIESFPTLTGVIIITFILLKLAPGNPLYSIIGERVTAERVSELKSKMDIYDVSLLRQLKMYLFNILKGDLGYSYITKQPVFTSLMEKLPNTIKLASLSIFLAVICGIGLGLIGALTRSVLVDKIILLITTFGISTPVFWFGLLLIYLFARCLRILPASGMSEGELAYIILPALTLGSRSAAYIARMTKASLQDVLAEPYVLSAKARGLSPFSVLRHSLKNAMIPIITLIGLDFGSYLNGSVLTETIFGWNGVGRYVVMAISQRDYPVIMGGVLMGTLIFIAVNILMDIFYVVADPRIELK
ncbi:ABC transporter permease [bacterium]|nr:ABC transporter permease [bacterium]